jgi:hypothetical protein
MLWTLAAALATAGLVSPPDSIGIARLKYGGGGDWYASPSALPNLLAAIRDRTGIAVSRREATVEPLDPTLSDHPFIYLTGHGNLVFTPSERNALREHLLAGGFLLANDSYGLEPSFRAEMAQMFPDAPLVELPPEHAIFHAFYDFPRGLPKVHEHDGKRPQAFGIFRGGRLLVLFVYESDIGDGWEDPQAHDDTPDVREQALRMGVNIFLHALGQPIR